MGLLNAMAMSMLLPVPDDDHCVVCPTCEGLVPSGSLATVVE
jgi:hypothetical protein